MKKLMLMLVVLVFVGSAFAQPAGPYRLAFITSTNIGVPWDCSVNLDGADAHIQALADGAGIGIGGYIVCPETGNPYDVTWKAIASASYVDARDHTKTNPFNGDLSVPIYLVDQTTLVASGNAQLWSQTVDLTTNPWSYNPGLQNIIGKDENGNDKSHWPHTGTYPDGTVCDGLKAAEFGPNNGRGFDNPGNITQGNGGATDQWVYRIYTQRPATEQLPIYGLSDIIPEPATMCLLGLGGLLLRRKR
jgi:hypothetical protein